MIAARIAIRPKDCALCRRHFIFERYVERTKFIGLNCPLIVTYCVRCYKKVVKREELDGMQVVREDDK